MDPVRFRPIRMHVRDGMLVERPSTGRPVRPWTQGAVVPIGEWHLIEGGELYYARRAVQELEMAATSIDPAVKAIHLNMAARYATLRELAALPGQGAGDGSEIDPGVRDR